MVLVNFSFNNENNAFLFEIFEKKGKLLQEEDFLRKDGIDISLLKVPLALIMLARLWNENGRFKNSIKNHLVNLMMIYKKRLLTIISKFKN